MKNTIKKSLLIGIGAIEASRPKVKKVLGEFEKAGLLKKKQVNAILGAVVSAAKKHQKILEGKASAKASVWKKKADGLARRLESKGKKTAKRWVSKAQRELR